MMSYVLSLISILLIGSFLFLAPALAAIAIRRSLSVAWHIVFLALCVLYAFSPLLLGVLGLHLAEQFNCSVDITIYTCAEAPQYEDLVTGLTFAPWGMVFTIPSGAAGAIGLLVSLALSQKAFRHQSGQPSAYFYRNRRHKAIAGICSAIAQNGKFPLLAVRAVAVLLTVWAPMIVPGVYVWMWLAFPLSHNLSGSDDRESTQVTHEPID